MLQVMKQNSSLINSRHRYNLGWSYLPTRPVGCLGSSMVSRYKRQNICWGCCWWKLAIILYSKAGRGRYYYLRHCFQAKTFRWYGNSNLYFILISFFSFFLINVIWGTGTVPRTGFKRRVRTGYGHTNIKWMVVLSAWTLQGR